MEAITSASSMAAAELISQTIELFTEAATEAKNAIVEKESFSEFSLYLDRIVPLLKELSKKETINADTTFVEILNQQVRLGKQLVTECNQKNRIYRLMNSRSITRRIGEITREISRALSLIPFSQLGVSASMKQDLGQLCDVMQSVEFKTAVADEAILKKIESGVNERNADSSYANNLLVSIAQALGISTERSSLRKELEDFKNEIEDAKLRKDQAEAIQMDQIIALLERADATSSPEEKEKKYLTKRTSLGSQPLEPLQSFYCPITREVMVDPVETASGHTFERAAIEKWLADGSNFCPLTMTPLDKSSLRPNKTLKQSIEEWKDRNTMITIASIKPKLSKPLAENEEDVICCLDELQSLCEERGVHREWIVLENYIPTLVGLLDGKSREIRTRTLVLLCILAKDSDDAKDRIAKVNGSVEYIVRSLGRKIYEGKLAVELLFELSQNETLKNHIGMVQGCILLLVTMSNNDDTQAATRAHELLAQLSFSDQNVIQMAKANYFTHLLRRLSSGSEEVKMCMVTTLAEMELTDHYKSSLFENGALDSLLHLISHGNTRMKETAAKAIRSLSTLPKNSIQMIKNGSVNSLVNLLYSHTSSHYLQDELAAIIMHLATSTMSQNYNRPPVSLFESDGDIDSLFSFTGCSRPLVQESLLHSFYAMCHSPLATTVKTTLRQKPENIQLLVDLCKNENRKVRANAVRLFCCLTEDGDDKEIIDRMGLQSIETLIKVIQSPVDEEEITSAMGVLSNLTQSSQLTESLLKAEGLHVISSCLRDVMQNRPHKKQLIENTVGSLCHFTVPTNQSSQKKVAETGVIPLLVQLLEVGTSLTKRKASISLGQLSKSSFELSHAIPRRGLFKCFSPQSVSACPVHQGICTVETSFCLVEADAVSPLVRLLRDSDLNVSEASLDALLTLIEAERLPYGSKVLAEADALHPIIKLLNCPSSSLQEKVLNALERIFRLLDMKQKYGHLAQTALVDLTQRGNNVTKSLAARILGQLNVLHDQSSYF
ncbi:putative U box domain, armadillo-like helical, Zinc finger, RING/FYVE/PHD-type [Helianthus annuus]|uniref:RING-type E3 ubiquitin transferase n=1 Tax=Helianthus annuus TaxID=4232 RepID=A0A9K3DU08_HELAN|nr:U-box domain-containing protein 44-like isoform X1 [Helianthus annuus]KAF5761595.1 putative U box domain, armadillo-like helical, Zinc finger, RING/FYVE/PHD-type [Helianthus annuus]KAJ0461783.1 putative adaptor protein Cbl domain superfamily [Helianthus annuus]KAJ0642169.1 putative adaptor protein Cbl domain superfamily [Helianthus annuus]KAJ0646060.1 putative adaptor protein Cbl domain superfamily [Helianthus annuus]KAJ0822697.1 putative U box domain, armadillo-like helical, Zinc finger, R